MTGRPIIFASTGERLDDFEPFYPDRMASRILDLGDILTLIEQAQQAFDEEEARKIAREVRHGHLHARGLPQADAAAAATWARIKKMIGMLPGARGMREQLENFDEREIVRTEAIIQSMTPAGAPQPEAAERLPPRCASPGARARR